MTTKTKQQMNNDAMEAAFESAKFDTNLNAIETILELADNNGWLWNAVKSAALGTIGSSFLILDDIKGRQGQLSQAQQNLVANCERQIEESVNLVLWASVEHIDRDVPKDYRASIEDSAQWVTGNRESREIADIQEALKFMRECADSPAELEKLEKEAKLQIEAVKMMGADNHTRVLSFMRSQLNAKLPAAFEVSDRTAFYIITRLTNWIEKRADAKAVMAQLRNVAQSARGDIMTEMKLSQAILPQVRTIYGKYEAAVNNTVGEATNGVH